MDQDREVPVPTSAHADTLQSECESATGVSVTPPGERFMAATVAAGVSGDPIPGIPSAVFVRSLEQALESSDSRQQMFGVLDTLAAPLSDPIHAILLRVIQGEGNEDLKRLADRVIQLQRRTTLQEEWDRAPSPLSDKLIETFQSLLGAKSARRRIGALSKVLKYRNPALLPYVFDAMAIEKRGRVLAAMLSLFGSLGTPRHVHLLSRYVDHADPTVVAGAVQALDRLIPDLTGGILKPLLDSNHPQVLAAALVALRPHAPRDVDKRLSSLLDSEEETHRLMALNIIERFDDVSHRGLIETFLRVETVDELREIAESFLKSHDETMGHELRSRLRNGLSAADPEARLAALEDARPHVSDHEIASLVQALAQFDRNEAVRKKSIELLKLRREFSQSSASAVNDLSAVMRELNDEDLVELDGRAGGGDSRSGVVAGISEAGDKVIETLNNLLGRRQPRLRMKAVLKVRKYRYSKLVPKLIESLEFEASPIVIAAIVATVGELGSEEHVSVLAPYISYQNHRVVAAAVIALHKLGGDSLLELFLPLLSREDKRIVSLALIALLRLDGESVIEYIAMMTHAVKDSSRRMALFCIQRIPPEVAEDILVDWSRRESSQALMREVYEALGERATLRVVGDLFVAKERDPSRELHVRGVFKQISERTKIPVEQLEATGKQYMEAHPELYGKGLDKSAREFQAGLLQDMEDRKRARKEAIQLKAYQQPLPIFLAGISGLLILAFSVDWSAKFQELTARGSYQTSDPLRATQSLLEAGLGTREPTRARAFSMPRGAGTDAYQSALENHAQQYLVQPAVLSGAQRVSESRRQLLAWGYQNSEYIEMQAMDQDRDEYDAALVEAEAQVEQQNSESAAAGLEEAYDRMDPKNYLVRQDLAQALLRLYIQMGQHDKARDWARKSLENQVKVYEIFVATARPSGKGSLATKEELETVKESLAKVDSYFEQVKDRLSKTRSPVGIPPEMRGQVAEAITKARAEGSLTPEQYQEVMAELQGQDL